MLCRRWLRGAFGTQHGGGVVVFLDQDEPDDMLVTTIERTTIR